MTASSKNGGYLGWSALMFNQSSDGTQFAVKHQFSGMWMISACPELFARFDQIFNIGKPAKDAEAIAVRLISSGANSEVLNTREFAQQFGWSPNV